MINILRILTRYFEELLNEDEKKLLLQTSKLCENIEFNKIDRNELRCFKIKNFCRSISMLKFATDKRNKNKYVINEKTTYYLGNVEMFRYMKSNYPKINNTENTFANAAKNGNLENMKWLKENGCPWKKDIFANATKNGNLENMKWLKENGCPWNGWTFASAAEKGNIENMKWLKENGCIISDYMKQKIREKYEIDI